MASVLNRVGARNLDGNRSVGGTSGLKRLLISLNGGYESETKVFFGGDAQESANAKLSFNHVNTENNGVLGVEARVGHDV